MRDISTTPRTFDFSSAPCTTPPVVAGCGCTPAVALKVLLPSFCNCCGLANVTSLSLPRAESTFELPSRTLIVPSRLIDTCRSVGCSEIGPPSPSTGLPSLVTSWPVGLICIEPVSYTHLRAHATPEHIVCRLLLE